MALRIGSQNLDPGKIRFLNSAFFLVRQRKRLIQLGAATVASAACAICFYVGFKEKNALLNYRIWPRSKFNDYR
jgi:hypothetical protein